MAKGGRQSPSERATKRKELTRARTEKGMGPLKLRKTEDGTTYELVSRSRSHATGLPEAKVYKVDKKTGKRTLVAVGDKTRKYF